MATITIEQWETRVALDLPVGTCPKCGAPMKGAEPVDSMGVVFLDSECVSCGHETTAPGGRRKQPATVVPFRRRHVDRLERPQDHQERAAGG